MSPLTTFCFLCALVLALSDVGPLNCIPRKSILDQSENVKQFREEGVWNYSAMLLREDLGLLFLGAREAIYALDIKDISIRKAVAYWKVTEEKQNQCKYKRKDPEVDCRNYVRILHGMDDGRMYVCGTNAFSPACDYMTYSDGVMTLEGAEEEGKGKCPFDPFQRHSSILVGGDLYSATSINFMGTEPVLLRSSVTPLRTEFKSSWLNEPNFVYMDVIPESVDSPDGDDDKVYLFFSENAVEYDFYNKLVVSRVARVCKGDVGGHRTLQKRWTTFVKARLDCLVPEPSLPYVVQDVFLLTDGNWRESVFFAVFTPQSGYSDLSAVCAYNTMAIGEVFSQGKFKTPVTVENSHVKWVMYGEELPSPRPGACINNEARMQGISQSLELPDKTLQFIRDRPLMDEAVQPLGGGPLLVKKGAMFTRIVVVSVPALDGRRYRVMFIGTENGFLQKAVNYDGEMFIIEEMRLFQPPEPIKVLRLSSSSGQLYAGSESSVVQVPLSECGRYASCQDCILARDPYCAWDPASARCTAQLSATTSMNLIQSLKDGNASRCPSSVTVVAENCTLIPGHAVKLKCLPDSNLARVHWLYAGRPLSLSDTKYYVHSEGILILKSTADDAGLYTCQSVEQVNGLQYPRTVAVYRLQLDSNSELDSTKPGPSVTRDPWKAESPSPPQPLRDQSQLMALQLSLALVSVLLAALLVWNLYKRHLPLPGRSRDRTTGSPGQRQTHGAYTDSGHRQVAFLATGKPLVSASNCNSKNKHSRELFPRNEERSLSPGVNLSSPLAFQYINDESEI